MCAPGKNWCTPFRVVRSDRFKLFLQVHTGIVKRLAGKLLCLGLLVILADQAVGFFLRRAYFYGRSGDYYRSTYTLDKTQEPVLVLGGSRAAHHYVSAMLDTLFGMKVYNTGRDDNEIFYSQAVFRAVTRRYKPQLVLLELAPREFYYARKSYDKLNSLLPYYRDHPEIKDIVELRGSRERYKLWSAVYPFNSKCFLILNGIWNPSNDPGISTSGFLPFHSTMKISRPDNFQREPSSGIDTNKVKAVTEIVNACKKRAIRLVMVCSPVYSNPVCPGADSILQLLSVQYQVPYFDYSTDRRFDDHPELFRDNSHLNEKGARIYTRLLADTIRSAGVLR